MLSGFLPLPSFRGLLISRGLSYGGDGGIYGAIIISGLGDGSGHPGGPGGGGSGIGGKYGS